MKPLFILIIAFVISVITLKVLNDEYAFQLSGRIAMGVMLLFTSVAHFKFAEGMAMMVPDFIPQKKLVVYATGILEIVAGIGLFFSSTHQMAAWFLIVLFLLMLPANINAAFKNIDYENATFNGKGKSYLWFRIPLQVFFIAWIYFSSICIINQ